MTNCIHLFSILNQGYISDQTRIGNGVLLFLSISEFGFPIFYLHFKFYAHE